MYRRPASIVTLALVAACSSSCQRGMPKGFLGSGVVEVRTYQVATTVQGQVTTVYKKEGQAAREGELLAAIDTVPLHLARQEAVAGIAQLDASIASKRAEIASLESEVQGNDREYKRAQGLVQKGSLPSQREDELQTRVEASSLRTKAARIALDALSAQRNGLTARLATVDDQIRRCMVRAPVSGILITRFHNEGEVIGPGQPLFELGNYDTARIDFFVPQPFLSQISLGQEMRVRLDAPGGALSKDKALFVPARVVWISDEAEFSPKNIQTRESRNELVFKVRVEAPNGNGVLKRGMPVEVWR